MILGPVGSCSVYRFPQQWQEIGVVRKIDSVFFYAKDSVAVRSKNDTIFVDKWHIRYRDKTTCDTIVNEKVVKETKELRVVPKYYKVVNAIFWTAILLFVGYWAIRLSLLR